MNFDPVDMRNGAAINSFRFAPKRLSITSTSWRGRILHLQLLGK
jgi:hypothetical protein